MPANNVLVDFALSDTVLAQCPAELLDENMRQVSREACSERDAG
ncbi:hypothetical protein ACFPTO_10585 [Paraburkholderia denitrificans]|uniref:Uncharacterized protein n=1 Tax=Paraburkholderia denitrificans TaxID=694025 RepID=A0ABW0J847_9BURK